MTSWTFKLCCFASNYWLLVNAFGIVFVFGNDGRVPSEVVGGSGYFPGDQGEQTSSPSGSSQVAAGEWYIPGAQWPPGQQPVYTQSKFRPDYQPTESMVPSSGHSPGYQIYRGDSASNGPQFRPAQTAAGGAHHDSSTKPFVVRPAQGTAGGGYPELPPQNQFVRPAREVIGGGSIEITQGQFIGSGSQGMVSGGVQEIPQSQFVSPLDDVDSTPFFDFNRNKWVCPADQANARHIYEKDVSYHSGSELGAEEDTLKSRRSRQITPISVMDALYLDRNANTRNFDAILQNLTGIEIVRSVSTEHLDKSGKISKNGTNVAARTAKPALCYPEVTTVSLDLPSDDPNVFYYPTCTRLARCGGCCSHHRLACQPTLTEQRQLTVTKMELKQGRRKYAGDHTLSVDWHRRCACQCKVKEQDCNALQVYVAQECLCACRNSAKERQCRGDNAYWDPSECRCRCKNVMECSTGTEFDNRTCRCARKPGSPIWYENGRGFNQRWTRPHEVNGGNNRG